MSIIRFHKYLTETSLTRIWQHMTNLEQESGILSAEKGKYRDQPKVNAERTFELAGKVRAAGFGYSYVEGHYVEPEGAVVETSVAIFGGTNGKLKGYLRRWREEYEQDSVLYKPEGTTHAFLLFSDGRETDIGTFHANRAGEFMTKLKGRPGTFVIESAFGNLNFFGRLARKYST
jgi:hypothetical protein